MSRITCTSLQFTGLLGSMFNEPDEWIPDAFLGIVNLGFPDTEY